jgi:ABC-type multidrug transport system ATPase subunit
MLSSFIFTNRPQLFEKLCNFRLYYDDQIQLGTVKEKYAYVEEVIKLLELEDVAEAIVGIEGFGISSERRKRLTIAVELASKPAFLIFLDEPTSGT